VIGIYGRWGEGKSSTLQLLRDALASHEDVVTVTFNPWFFSSEAALVEGFLTLLARSLDETLTTQKEKAGKILRRLGDLVSGVTLKVGEVELKAGEGISDLGGELSMVDLEAQSRLLHEILAKSSKRLVVFVDDIDRLDRREVQTLFKLIKLGSGFANTTFVLAFDPDIVAASLAESYAAGHETAGFRFLEKIVQLPLRLPAVDTVSLRRIVSDELTHVLVESGVSLSADELQIFGRRFVDGLEPCLTTVRQAKRYANAVRFALPLLRGEVNTVDLLLLEGIRCFYPGLHDLLREQPGLFLDSVENEERDSRRTEVEKAFRGALADFSPLAQKAARDLVIQLFPRLKGVLGNSFFTPDLYDKWDREKRLCSPDYFPKFFRYGVQPGDVSDEAVEGFLKSLAGLSSCTVAEHLRALAPDEISAERLIQKLRLREKDLDEKSSEALALGLAKAELALSDETNPLKIVSALDQTAILISRLVGNLPNVTGRERLAQEVVKTAIPLPLAFECASWLTSKEGDPPAERLLPPKEESHLHAAVVRLISEHAQRIPPYREFPKYGARLLWAWNQGAGSGEVAKYLTERFTNDPAEAVELLNSFVGRAWSFDTGLARPSDFMANAYKQVARLVSPEIVMNALRERYSDLESSAYHQTSEIPVSERVARQFAFLYHGGKE
jgi:hypothetical protein